MAGDSPGSGASRPGAGRRGGRNPDALPALLLPPEDPAAPVRLVLLALSEQDGAAVACDAAARCSPGLLDTPGRRGSGTGRAPRRCALRRDGGRLGRVASGAGPVSSPM